VAVRSVIERAGGLSRPRGGDAGDAVLVVGGRGAIGRIGAKRVRASGDAGEGERCRGGASPRSFIGWEVTSRTEAVATALCTYVEPRLNSAAWPPPPPPPPPPLPPVPDLYAGAWIRVRGKDEEQGRGREEKTPERVRKTSAQGRASEREKLLHIVIRECVYSRLNRFPGLIRLGNDFYLPFYRIIALPPDCAAVVSTTTWLPHFMTWPNLT
jgi:hypothetical protein